MAKFGEFVKVGEPTGTRGAITEGIIKAAENHSIIGGLGEGVAAILAENIPTPMIRFGIEDEFSQSGQMTPDIDELKMHFSLGAEDLALTVRECIAKRERLQTSNRNR